MLKALLISIPLLALPALASDIYDGIYHGQLTGMPSNGMNCTHSASIQIVVTNDQLEYHHFANALITATVALDGTFSGSGDNQFRSGPVQVQTLKGKITGDAILARTDVGTGCSYTLTLKKF